MHSSIEKVEELPMQLRLGIVSSIWCIRVPLSLYSSAAVGTTSCVDGIPICILQISASSDRSAYQERWGAINYLNCFKSRSFCLMGFCKGEQTWKLNTYGLKAASGKDISDQAVISFLI